MAKNEPKRTVGPLVEISLGQLFFWVYVKGDCYVRRKLEENRIRIEVVVSLVLKKEKKTLKERKIEEVFAYSSSEAGGTQTEDEAVEEACQEIAEKLIDAITWDLGFSPI